MKSKTTIFSAKSIITMYPEHPRARAVAVREGRILGIGELDEMVHWVKNSPFTPFDVDTSFEDKVLMPGLVDAHTHIEVQALLYSGHFVSQIPWPRSEGGFFPVYPTKQAVLNRMKKLDQELPPGEILFGVAYDENKIGEFLHVSELDDVSTERPILISNLVLHRFWANSHLLEKAGIHAGNIPPYAEADSDGRPNGTLLETTGFIHAASQFPQLVNLTEEKLRYIMPLYTASGNTTICDAGFGLINLEDSYNSISKIFADSDVGLRSVCLPFANSLIQIEGSIEALIEKVLKLRRKNMDKFRIGGIKLYTDGSIISRTAPIGWPGYWDGSPEGQWECDSETLKHRLVACHEAGLPTVTHCNGRPGIQAMIEAVKAAQAVRYRPDMRHRVDHCYNITEAQLRVLKDLGAGVQFFTPQIYYYGDAHQKLQGPNRSRNITPTGTAKRIGTSWGFHNDPPGTPQLPWVGAWATVQRKTESNVVLGPEQRVTVMDALRAMTIEHAWQLHLDHEVGSIEFGKKADFCVLEEDPLAIDPDELKDIPVWGTVFGGEPRIA